MKTVFIKPAPDRIVMMPDRDFQRLPDEGARVVLDAHYQRALMDGDCVEIDEQPALELSGKSAKQRATSEKE